MTAGLIGWLGLTVIVLGVLAALAADILRLRLPQTDPEATPSGLWTGSRRWVSVLTSIAVLLALVAAVATFLRFTTLA